MTSTTGETLLGIPRPRALVRGRAADPAWVRPALVGLLGATALLYLAGLSASGWGNAFYAAAVEAGAKSWKAFFFGSFDSSNFITVDKPPASLWVMDISARLFGVSSWSILAPQAIEGVAAVGLLYATVRRRFGPAAGLIAGGVLATTPVAVLMFRYDNPDALLTLLLVASAYALTRSLERGSGRWLALVGVLVGIGFLTKMLQAFLVVPGFALVYLVAAPAALRARVRRLLVAGVALVVSAAWWIAAVALWPASSRPYIGGSQDNSILNLAFGYNGLGRITGNESGSIVGGGGQGGAGAWGPTGLTRLFGSEMGTQISWLLPTALLFGVVLLWSHRRAPRTDGARAALLLWGSWLVVTGAVFSFAQGIIHPYYTVVLAPPIGALVGIGSVWAWPHRERALHRLTGAAALAASAVWAWVLLDRAPTWHPWLRSLVLAAGLAGAVLVAVVPSVLPKRRLLRVAFASVLVSVGLAAPTAYAVQTASTAHTGALPTAGPGNTFGAGPPSSGGRGGLAPRRPGGLGPPATGNFRPPAGGFPGRGGGTGRLGGLLDARTPSKALVTLLRRDAANYSWVAATVGANSAAGIQLATGEPVMAIGGFNGTDPTPTLAQFEADVAARTIHYFVGATGGGNSASANPITAWVAAHFPKTTVGGVTVYDLTN